MEFLASRRLLHLGIALYAVALVAFFTRDWIAAAAAVPLLGMLLFAALETMLPLPGAARRRVEGGTHMLLRDETEVSLVFQPVPLPGNVRFSDELMEGLREVPGSATNARPAGRYMEAGYAVRAERRGRYEVKQARVARKGWLGLFERSVALPVDTKLEVLPLSAHNLGVKVRPRPPSRTGVTMNTVRRGPGDEFFALRQYLPGDSLSDVNWKASARMNRIITNEFLPEEPARYLLYVDTRMTGHEAGRTDVFERSLELASVLVEALVQARAHVGMVTLSHHSMFMAPSSGQGQLNRLRAMIQDCRPGQVGPIRDLVIVNLAHLPARAEAILVTSDVYDPSLAEAVLALRARHGRVTLIAPSYPGAEGDDLDAAARRASAEVLNVEQAAVLAGLVGYADRTAQWPPDEPIPVTLARLGMTGGQR